VLNHAVARGVRISFEPEPGMFIDTMERFTRLQADLAHPSLGLTLDVGHVHCLSDGDVGEHVRRWRHLLWNVHVSDMQRGVHEHLMFGEGDMPLEPVLRALREAHYPGPLHVELSRHSHDAVRAARRAFEYLQPLTVKDTP
jgi:L-ribulose-5-phosphate 3-epimerase